MPDYGKLQEPFIYGYAATGSNQQQSHGTIPAGLQYAVTQAQVPHGALGTGQMPFGLAQQQHEAARDESDHPTSEFSFIGRQSQQMLEITSYEPRIYSPGTKISIRIQSPYDLSATPSSSFMMTVGSHLEHATLSKLGHHDHYHHFQVTADAPSFQSTEWSTPSVPLSLQMFDGTGGHFTIDIGPFYYGTLENYQRHSASSSLAQKRKISPEAREYGRSPAKRPSTQHLRTQLPEDSETYENTRYSAPPSSPFLNPGAPAPFGYSGDLGRHQRPQFQSRSSQRLQYQHPSSDASQALRETASPMLSTPRTAYGSSSMSRPRTVSASTAPASSRRPEPSSPANPLLIRTSTIQASPPSSVIGSGSAQDFNPYAMYPSNAKAALHIEGDLDKMRDNWTDEEWEANRRLVRFTRNQDGSIIRTTFEPVTLEGRTASDICISCIWWEEKHDYFVTSVDAIYLLESLVGVRFTVEEKNRIRRNLEGFRPATVSKAKPDSEEFFKLIMGFPNPKPRNIEKDVKVFPWRILAGALKKIIGKYVGWFPLPLADAADVSQSASYSSTAGALAPATGRGGGSSSGSSALSADALSVSPNSRSLSHGYASGMAPDVVMPAARVSAGSLAVQIPSAGPADFRTGVGAMMPSQLDTASAHEYRPYPLRLQQPITQQQPSPSRHPSVAYPHLFGSTARSSWDLSSYVDASPVTATPGGAAPTLQPHHEGSMTPLTEPTATAGAQAQEHGYHGMPEYQQARRA
ncbi:MAG: hypothetical protein M1821_005412 [Bathelium mastoideum]|nr:MAG: hypothetical protein M1821_005412 [Bathelium mastoideum]